MPFLPSRPLMITWPERRVVRALLGALVIVPAVAASPAQAHHTQATKPTHATKSHPAAAAVHAEAPVTAERVEASKAAAMSGMSHAMSTAAGVAGATTPAVDESMFVVGTPERPIITRGPRGPLWTLKAGSAMQGVVPVATASRTVLTTSQATKKLSKSCQKLLGKSTKKMSKSDKKKRAKCAEQRAKLIKDSKKKPSTSTPTTGGGTTTPSNPGTSTPGSPSNPGTGTPTTTPTPGATPAPGQTPTPTPAPAACVPSGQDITVTATAIEEPLLITRGCANAGNITFTLTTTDATGAAHNLYLVPAGGDRTKSSTTIISAPVLASGQTSRTKTVSIAAGSYTLYCSYPGHEAMVVPFTVL